MGGLERTIQITEPRDHSTGGLEGSYGSQATDAQHGCFGEAL